MVLKIQNNKREQVNFGLLAFIFDSFYQLFFAGRILQPGQGGNP